MAQCCPLSHTKTDAYQERIEAFMTASVVAVFILSCSFVLPLILIGDFLLRLISKNRYGIFKPFARKFKKLFRLPRVQIDDAPKRFARILGMIMSLNLIVLYAFDQHEAAVILSLIFISLSLMDAFFDYCVGCKLYMLFKRH